MSFGFCLVRRNYSQELRLLAAVTECFPEARHVSPQHGISTGEGTCPHPSTHFVLVCISVPRASVIKQGKVTVLDSAVQI